MDGWVGTVGTFGLWWCEGMIQSCWLVRRAGDRDGLQRFSGLQEATEREQKGYVTVTSLASLVSQLFVCLDREPVRAWFDKR